MVLTKRQMAKVATGIAIASLFTFSIYTLQTEHLLTNLSTQITGNTDPASDDDKTLPVFEHPNLKTDDKDLNYDIDTIVYTHKNGFETGKANFKNQNEVSTLQYDNKGRLLQIAIRITPATELTHTVKMQGASFTEYNIIKNAPTLWVTPFTWEHGLHPYLDKLHSYSEHADTDIIMVVSFAYNNDDDLYPHYIDLRAFTPEDMGKACSIWITFYNNDPYNHVNYQDNTQGIANEQ